MIITALCLSIYLSCLTEVVLLGGIRTEDSTLLSEISALINETQRAPMPLLPHEDTGNSATYEPGSRPSPDTISPCIDLGLPSLQKCKK